MSTTVSPQSGETFTERMQAKTLGRSDIQPRRGVNYNYPLRWYVRPDGDIVQLQSDPNNRALYADLGFHLLADVAARGETMSEVEEWERLERPKIIAEQRTRAKLINAIRKADLQNPVLMLNLDTIDQDSIEELEQMIADIKAAGHKVRVIEPKYKDEPEPALLRGVETAAASSLEDLQRKLGDPNSQSRTIEGVGKDPIDEARRRSRP
jgi:hypothetical protein